MSRRWLRAIGRGAIGALLFAQMAIAAYACPTLSSPQVAGLVTTTLAHGPDCNDLVGTMDPAATNLCAEHCKSDRQSAQTSTVNVPTALLSVRYETPPLPALALPLRASAVSMDALLAGKPPHAVLHCVLRT